MNLEFYKENGYWIEEGGFTKKECFALIDEGQMLDNFLNCTFRPQMMPHRTSPIFLGALRCPSVVYAIEQAVGGMAVGLQTEYFYCPPKTKGFTAHQDNFFVQAKAGAFASAWTALVDTTPENGGLIIYPGTHKLGLLPVKDISEEAQTSQDPNARKTESIVPEGYEPLPLTVPQGSVVIIDGHLVHFSNTNATEGWRNVLLATYIRKGEPFRAGNYARREAVEL